MRFIDILREEEEEGVGSARAKYDVAVQTDDTSAALDALDNIENYGVYAQSLRNPEAIKKAFGPSIPAQKAGAALKDWDSKSEEAKKFKLTDIKERVPEDYEKATEAAKDNFEQWKTEGNDGDITDYLLTLSGKELPKDLIGRYGKNYYPLKTPDNLKKYGGKLEQDVHFYTKNDKIVFPFDKSPYKSKPYLQKVLTTIMDTANIEHKLVDIERLDTDDSEVIEKPKKVEVPPLTVKADSLDKVEKIRDQFKKEIGDVPTAKYETEPINVDGERKYKLIVTGISSDQRQKLLIKKAMLKEGIEFDIDLYRIQKLAGL